MGERKIRAALERHWAASDADELEAEHAIYREDAVLDFRSRAGASAGGGTSQAPRAAQPDRKRFSVRRITGAGALWVTEYALSHDGRPSHTVSIMEFRDGKAAHETRYLADPLAPGPSRAQWVGRIP